MLARGILFALLEDDIQDKLEDDIQDKLEDDVQDGIEDDMKKMFWYDTERMNVRASSLFRGY